jgi:hypothetical protein
MDLTMPTAADLEAPGNGLAFVVPVDKVAGVPHVWNAAASAPEPREPPT